MHVRSLPPLTPRLLQELSPPSSLTKAAGGLFASGSATQAARPAPAAPMLSASDINALTPLMMNMLVQAQFRIPKTEIAETEPEEELEDDAEEKLSDSPDQEDAEAKDDIEETPNLTVAQQRAAFYRQQFD